MTQVTITGDYNGFHTTSTLLRAVRYVVTDVHDTHHNSYNPRVLEFTNNYSANQSHKNNFHPEA